MTQPDFGPIPVSRLKAESAQIFAALKSDRRVLISRRGQVVAAIEPASIERFPVELARFALPGGALMDELSASDLSQGSPSEAVRAAAEEGSTSYVTRNNKVYGVLSRIPELSPQDGQRYAEWVDSRERALSDFEKSHPGASAEELTTVAQSFPPFTATSPPDAGAEPIESSAPTHDGFAPDSPRVRGVLPGVLPAADAPYGAESTIELRALLSRTESLQAELSQVVAGISSLMRRMSVEPARPAGRPGR